MVDQPDGIRSPELGEFTFRTLPCDDLSPADVDLMMALFESNYREANRGYLERSLAKLKYATIAMTGETPAAFALGEARLIDLPHLPAQAVALAGLCCVAPDYRRRGLFGEVESRCMRAAGFPVAGRVLSCGRMAHSVSFRLMAHNAGAIPRPGVAPSAWQQEVGSAIAAAYRVKQFNPRTFVCKGDGAPIGYPVLDVEATPEEWELFRNVDRSRGDSLLGLAWIPDPPQGW